MSLFRPKQTFRADGGARLIRETTQNRQKSHHFCQRVSWLILFIIRYVGHGRDVHRGLMLYNMRTRFLKETLFLGDLLILCRAPQARTLKNTLSNKRVYTAVLPPTTYLPHRQFHLSFTMRNNAPAAHSQQDGHPHAGVCGC